MIIGANAFAISQKCLDSINNLTVKAVDYGSMVQLDYQNEQSKKLYGLEDNLMVVHRALGDANGHLKQAISEATDQCR